MKVIVKNGERLRHFADSSAQRNGQPWFMPDMPTGWAAIVCPAIRISRLGTHISRKFAERYYDAVSAAIMFMPAEFSSDVTRADESFFVRDSGYSMGTSAEAVDKSAVHVISIDDRSLDFSCVGVGFDEMVSEVSGICTLKMGDIIIDTSHSIVVDVAEGHHLAVELDGQSCLDLRIK